MPELPEVEILVRHLRPLLRGRTIQAVDIRRPKVLQPTPPARFRKHLIGARFLDVTRRGKYLLFQMRARDSRAEFVLLGHLGMTGRMFMAAKREPPPKHAAVILDLGASHFVYADPRYFGRLTLDNSPVDRLGPEPWDESFDAKALARELKRFRQPIKVKLLDQSLVAGVGNIYASEALFRAGLSPRRAAHRLTLPEVARVWRAVRAVMAAAIAGGSTMPLNFGPGKSDGLFYYGAAGGGGTNFYTERLMVYDRRGQPCVKCRTPIRRIVQAARSTFFCPHCQKT